MVYFDRAEFECKCGCGFDVVDFELAEVLDKLRAYFRVAVVINSGNRCQNHNDVEQLRINHNYVPGSSNSQHLHGKAADIVAVGVHADEVADYLEKTYPDKFGIGRYRGRTHIDVRSSKARWDTRPKAPG